MTYAFMGAETCTKDLNIRLILHTISAPVSGIGPD